MAKIIYYTLDAVAGVLAWIAYKISNSRLMYWALENTPELNVTEEERKKYEREGEFRELICACDALEGLFAKDPKRAPLAHRAVMMMMQHHYPEEWREYFG